MDRASRSILVTTSVSPGHLPLRLWFCALYRLTRTKQGVSSIELGRRLGVTQATAWKIKHKYRQVMLERDATKRLTGRVEIEEAYLEGGERHGGKRGRGTPGKTPRDENGELSFDKKADNSGVYLSRAVDIFFLPARVKVLIATPSAPTPTVTLGARRWIQKDAEMTCCQSSAKGWSRGAYGPLT
jgi:hypothetical protein